jgi:ferredoxin
VILTVSKSWADIKEAIDRWQIKKAVVIGCGECAARCATGGTEGVSKLIDQLKRDNITVLSSIIIQEPCDIRITKQELKRIKNAIDAADGLIVATCGSGAQTIGEITDKPIIITTDTIMMAQTERIGVYHEKCRACGYCWLNETGGICPITACAKSLLNGPCGGVKDGKCEVGNYSFPCAWIQIYEKLKTQDKLELFKKYRAPCKWSQINNRREIDIRQEMKEEYGCK